MSSKYNTHYYKEGFQSLASLPHTVIPAAPRSRMRCRLGQMRMSDLVKIVLGITFGYSLRLATEQGRTHPSVQSCTPCPTNSEFELINSDSNQQLRESYKPRTRFEVLRFEYFNSSVVFENFDDGPKRGLLGHHKADLKDIIAQTMALYNSGKSKAWSMKKLINGYRRLDPLRGEEYFLDMEISTRYGQYSESKPDTISEIHRFQMVKPFSVAQMISQTEVTANKMIHFILPISYDIDHRLEAFLSNFEEVCLKPKEQVYLLVVLFITKSHEATVKGEAVIKKIMGLGSKYPSSHIRVIQTNKAFNRALGLDLGAKQLPPEMLMFFTDTDMVWTRDFLTRCRYNAVQGQQVFYPIVFAQYNPEMVSKYSPQEEIKYGLREINKHTGHWVYYGFGMACMYSMDYRVVGGFNLNRQGWGGEDVELYDKHVNSNLNVFRAADPGLIHIYHNKTCDPNLTADQMRMCVGSLANGYASKGQLGVNLLMPNVKLQAAPARLPVPHA